MFLTSESLALIIGPHEFIRITKDKRPLITISYDLKGGSFGREMATNMNDR
jgi:hypothetical protein